MLQLIPFQTPLQNRFKDSKKSVSRGRWLTRWLMKVMSVSDIYLRHNLYREGVREVGQLILNRTFEAHALMSAFKHL